MVLGFLVEGLGLRVYLGLSLAHEVGCDGQEAHSPRAWREEHQVQLPNRKVDVRLRGKGN